MRIPFLTARPRPLSIPLPEGRPALFAPLMLVTAVLAAFALLGLTGNVTAEGYHVQSLERLRSAQQRDVLQLETEVAALGSLTRAGEQARVRWNMAPPEKVLHIEVGVPLSSDASATISRSGR